MIHFRWWVCGCQQNKTVTPKCSTANTIHSFIQAVCQQLAITSHSSQAIKRHTFMSAQDDTRTTASTPYCKYLLGLSLPWTNILFVVCMLLMFGCDMWNQTSAKQRHLFFKTSSPPSFYAAFPSTISLNFYNPKGMKIVYLWPCQCIAICWQIYHIDSSFWEWATKCCDKVQECCFQMFVCFAAQAYFFFKTNIR